MSRVLMGIDYKMLVYHCQFVTAHLSFLQFILQEGSLYLPWHRARDIWDTLVNGQHANDWDRDVSYSFILLLAALIFIVIVSFRPAVLDCVTARITYSDSLRCDIERNVLLLRCISSITFLLLFE